MAQETIETIRELKLERLLKLFENRNLGDCWNDTKTEVVAFPYPVYSPDFSPSVVMCSDG